MTDAQDKSPLSSVLASCPFCGTAKPAMHPNDIAPGGAAMALDGSTVQYAHCDGCGAEGPQGFTQAEAVAAWNRRSLVRADWKLAADCANTMRHLHVNGSDECVEVARSLDFALMRGDRAAMGRLHERGKELIRSAPVRADRDAVLEEVARAAANYVRCSQSLQLTPYIKENGRYGTKSPWTELCEAFRALTAKSTKENT